MTGAAATATFTVFQENTSITLKENYCTLVVGEYDDNSLWLLAFEPISFVTWNWSYTKVVNLFIKKPTTVYQVECPMSGETTAPFSKKDSWKATDANDSTKNYDFITVVAAEYTSQITRLALTGYPLPFVFQ